MKSTIKLFLVLIFTTSLLFVSPLIGETLEKAVIRVKSPIPIDNVVNPALDSGLPSSTPGLNFWQIKNKAKIIGDPRIVIKDECILGWEVDYVKGDPVSAQHRYAKFSQPFILPKEVSEKQVLDDSWKSIAKNFREFDCHPLMLNCVTRGDARTVYGFWYMVRGGPYSRYDRSKSSFVMVNVTPALIAKMQEFATTPPPFPEFVIKQPELIVKNEIPIPARGDAIVMEPFKVEEMKGWIGLTVRLDKNGKLIEIQVTNVTLGKPFADAGITVGMFIKSIHGIDAKGLTRMEFDSNVMGLAFQGDLRIEIIERPGSKPREIIIPASKLVRRETVASTQ